MKSYKIIYGGRVIHEFTAAWDYTAVQLALGLAADCSDASWYLYRADNNGNNHLVMNIEW